MSTVEEYERLSCVLMARRHVLHVKPLAFHESNGDTFQVSVSETIFLRCVHASWPSLGTDLQIAGPFSSQLQRSEFRMENR